MSFETEPSRSPVKKLLAIGAGVVAMFVIVLGGLWYYGLTVLDENIAALRAQGMPTDATEMNAFYVVPEGVTDTTSLWVHVIRAVQSANLGTRGNTLPILGSSPSPVPLPGETWAELDASRALLAEVEAELTAIRQASAVGGQVRFPIDLSAGFNTMIPLTQETRQVARVLSLDAYVSAHDGKGARAIEDVKGIFALSNAMRGEPILISQLVRIAIFAVGCDTAVRLMPHCAWSDDDLKSLQSTTRSAQFKEEMARAFCGERAMCISGLDSMPLGPMRQTNARAMLERFQLSIDSFSGSWPEVLERQQVLGDELVTMAKSGVVNRVRMAGVLELAPAILQASIAGARADARQKYLAVATAIERFRLKHNRVPETLAEIEDLIADGVPPGTEFPLLDPFDGKPLRYRVEDKRILIYSVGDDKKDNGGDVEQVELPGQPVHQARDLGISIERRGPMP